MTSRETLGCVWSECEKIVLENPAPMPRAARERLQDILGRSNCYCASCAKFRDLYWLPKGSTQ